ncbi:MAG: type I glyceraldehyde-3-phosphate dehydrogenase [Deltaproteobacteria bacterium]|jgi:glyceraldehyde 3-phosphate dehydrogenase
MSVRVAINGFGRIGRQIAKIMLRRPAIDLELVAVNTLESPELSAHLLAHDTLYGGIGAEVERQERGLAIGGRAIDFLHHVDPKEIPWGDLGIDIVIDSSGAGDGRLESHIQQGALKVIVAGSSREADVIICVGVNHERYEPEHHRIICAGSCTTNCIGPAAKVIHDRFGIDLLTTTIVHSYTTGQNLLDGSHADLRRARSAGSNIIPTTTSATEQVGQVLPDLAGRVTGVAMRVPTPVVHAADLVVKTNKRGTGQELLAALEEAATHELHGILAVNHAPLVSSDLKGSPFSCVVDAEFTDFRGDLIKTILWHDNEFSYSLRLVDLAELVAAGLK